MITTIYTCDKCGMAVEVSQLFRIAIIFKGAGEGEITGYSYQGALAKGPEAQWCEPCLFAAGLKARWRDGKREESSPALTLEDLVREIAREEIGPGR